MRVTERSTASFYINAALIATSFIVFVSCGGFEAAQHPDDNFRYGRGISSADGFGNYINSHGQDPRFRRARVTTQSGPLRLKTEARSDASSPRSGRTELQKDDEVDVFWPTDIVNNHIKVYVDGRTLWVTHRSNGGREYVTLLEDIYLPESNPGNSGIVAAPNSPPFFGQMGPVTPAPRPPTSGGGDPFIPSDLRRISLSSTAINNARDAINSVRLSPADVQACSFDPVVGNNSGSNNCYERIVISSNFRNFVARHGNECAISAGQEAFGRRPSKILFHTSGAGQVNQNRTVGSSSTRSTHSTGQAFDLFAVSVFFGGSSEKVIMHKDHTDGSSTAERRNHSFYWAFTNCWRARVQSHAACPCGGDRAGTLTYLDNSAHYNHLHMSLPMCNRSTYNVACI